MLESLGRRNRAQPIRGRGTELNPANRFDKVSLEVLPADTPGPPGGAQVPTRVYYDSTRTVINRVDSPDLPFRWTLNPYRGCEHGCLYCASGETRILMADGGTKHLGDLRVGEEVYGTIRDGTYRKFVRTVVLAHWETVKPAYRLTFDDGTALVASADHRLLTRRGWKHVLGAEQGALRRPHLTQNDALLGISDIRVPALILNREYAVGYLCGLIRGDGHLASYSYLRRARRYHLHQFRLALIDREPLDRAATFLRRFSVDTHAFVFQAATSRRREMHAIRNSSRDNVEMVRRLIAWQSNPTEEWSKGFLAGIFDAEGSFSGGIMRIVNTDPTIIEETEKALRRFGFRFEREHRETAARKPMCVVRVKGGIPEHLRFFRTVDPAIQRKRDIGGTSLKNSPNRRVVAIELMGNAHPLFDITTGTGDFIANGVVSHNCYARPTHEALGFSCGLDFETKIVAKPEAPRLLRRELSAPGWRPEPIVMSGVTDPYQPLEAKLRITRACLEVLADYRQPVSLVTKSRLICRDIDLLGELARFGAVCAAISVTTLDQKLAAAMEPRASRPQDRLRAIRELSEAGIPVMVMAAPIIPGLNDREIPGILRAASEAGARSAGWVMLRLPHQVKTLFLDWLRVHLPDRAARIEALVREVRGGMLYDPRFGSRHRGKGAVAEQITAMFRLFARRHGLDAPLPRLSAGSFRLPEPTLFDDLGSPNGSLEPAA